MKPAYYDFAQFAEYKDFTTMEWYYESQKYTRNQFLPHVGSSDATVVLNGRELINYSSYNYLALACDPRVKEAAKQAIDDFGTGFSSLTVLKSMNARTVWSRIGQPQGGKKAENSTCQARRL